MNVIHFVVLILIGVVCANVSAIRQPERESKETKLGISVPKTATTNGVGDQLYLTVISNVYHSEYVFSSATDGPGGPSATAYAGSSGSISGTVIVDGPNEEASSTSRAGGQASSAAGSSPSGVSARGSSSGDANTTASGRTVTLPDWIMVGALHIFILYKPNNLFCIHS